MNTLTGSCAICSAPLIAAANGTMPIYCSHACRQAAYRIRKAQEHVTTRIAPQPVPRVKRTVSREELAVLILEAHALGAAFMMAATKAEYRFRPQCQRIGEAIQAALEAEGL